MNQLCVDVTLQVECDPLCHRLNFATFLRQADGVCKAVLDQYLSVRLLQIWQCCSAIDGLPREGVGKDVYWTECEVAFRNRSRISLNISDYLA